MKTDRDKAILLLKTGKGQIDAVLKMIEQERYCMDIVNQILAAESLIKKSGMLILKQHMDTCIKKAFENDNSDEKIQEIIDILGKVMK
ncbi:metal-sensing transcriptional repressor [Cetobacterium sp. 2A]|uniref:metal-sensing transcriptional repressor n=1 Tax=unclassified Cetobacterium TaxID=2630983 RepID=UPI00163CCF63|nr:metal-sensing transcriptional repressor [Cetobacterium sp. 2A]MBC2857106.1 metal-sensing transcriptional repressor [Cetobacterium sp. 2A]